MVDYNDFEDARIIAGVFVSELPEVLNVAPRTLRRWKNTGLAPWWAWRILNLMSGDLSPFGWPDWELKRGVLYQKNLNYRYHHWQPGDLLGELFTLRTIRPMANDPTYCDQIALPFQRVPHV